MRKGDSHRNKRRRRPSGEALWNAAAVAGMLLIGLVVGGIVGVVLDRQGLLGAPRRTVTAQVAQPAVPTVGAPQPHYPPSAPAPDRELAELRYQEAARNLERRAAPAPDSRPAATAPDYQQAPPAQRRAGVPAWQQYAVAVPPNGGRPMIAVVLDDVGVNRHGAEKAIELPGPVTLSFMTYASDLAEMTARARQAGHELMLHVPMQPLSNDIDPGPNVLRDDLPKAELRQRLVWGLDRFRGYVGINNHMGSRFTASPDGMGLVMSELRARGLLFLDSLTAADSVGARLAARNDVPYAVRDVFIDNNPDDPAALQRQLALLEQAARERGYAVGIGHPHDGTVAALKSWIPEVQARGFELVPISAVVRYRQRLAQRQTAGAG